MWKSIFAELEGEAFANDKVEVNAKIVAGNEFFNLEDFPLLIWSVRIV